MTIDIDIALLVGVLSLILAVPLTVVGNLLTPRLISYLEKRKLIKTHKTRQQALQIYNRIRAFREGRRDKYAYYMLLGSSAVISAVLPPQSSLSCCSFLSASKLRSCICSWRSYF